MNVEKADKPIEILIIENNPDDLLRLRRMLDKSKSVSFRSNVADNISTGIKRLTRGNIDVVLLCLPSSDRQELDALISIKSHVPDVPVVMLADSGDDSSATAAMDAGAQCYLGKKQIDEYLLVQSICHAIRHKQVEQELIESREKLRIYLEDAPDGIYINDLKGTFLYGNKKSEKITGYTKEELVGKSFLKLKLLLPKYLAKAGELLALNAMGRPTGPDDFELAIKNGNRIWVEINTRPIKQEGKTVVIGFVRDITERKRAEEALVQERQRDLAIAVLASKLLSPFSIEDISDMVLENARQLTNSTYGFVGYIDQETGYMVSPTMTRGIWESCQVVDKTIVFKKFGGLWGWVLNNRKSILTNVPADDPRSTGIPTGHISIKNFLSAPALIGNELVGQVALANSTRDYNEHDLVFVERLATLYALALQRRRTEETISHQAYYDALTGLPNRILFNDRFNLAVAGARRYKQKIALMMLDIDLFKNINDSLGHDAGDELLKAFGSRLAESVRKTDTVSRMGGDEFVILMPEVIEMESVTNVAQKILEATRKPFKFHNRKLTITTSIGIAVYPGDGKDAETLIKHADIAMYQVKKTGRNNYLCYTPSMSTSIPE